MSRLPRILPLAAVAVAGVLAINLMAGARDFPSLLSGARAWAEDIAPKAKAGGKAAPKAAPAAASTPAPLPALSPLPPTPAQIAAGVSPSGAPQCVPGLNDLAARAELSPAALQNLQSLQARSRQLDDREKGLDNQTALFSATEVKLDGKIATMQDLKKQLEALLGQADVQEQAENARLVKTYETMRAQPAAAALSAMSDEVRLPIMAHMKEAKLADVLRYMSPADAASVTQKLAQRTSSALALDRAKAAIAASAPSTTAAPKAGAPAPGRSGTPAPTASNTQPKAATPPATNPPAAAPKTAAATPAPARGGTAPTTAGAPARSATPPVAAATPPAAVPTPSAPPAAAKAAPKTG